MLTSAEGETDSIIRPGAPPEWALAHLHWMVRVEIGKYHHPDKWVHAVYTPRRGPESWQRPRWDFYPSISAVYPEGVSEFYIDDVDACYPCEPDSPLPVEWPENPTGDAS